VAGAVRGTPQRLPHDHPERLGLALTALHYPRRGPANDAGPCLPDDAGYFDPLQGVKVSRVLPLGGRADASH